MEESKAKVTNESNVSMEDLLTTLIVDAQDRKGKVVWKKSEISDWSLYHEQILPIYEARLSDAIKISIGKKITKDRLSPHLYIFQVEMYIYLEVAARQKTSHLRSGFTFQLSSDDCFEVNSLVREVEYILS